MWRRVVVHSQSRAPDACRTLSLVCATVGSGGVPDACQTLCLVRATVSCGGNRTPTRLYIWCERRSDLGGTKPLLDPASGVSDGRTRRDP